MKFCELWKVGIICGFVGGVNEGSNRPIPELNFEESHVGALGF